MAAPVTQPEKAASSEHVPALDGVRGLAILAVIAFHARVSFVNTSEISAGAFQFVSQGRLGVTLFFVLSGFLITGILLDTRGSESYFRRFYFRRVLRIFPLYFVYLFLVFLPIRALWLLTAGDDPWKAVNAWWYLGYLQNLPAAHATGNRFLNHLWSLAIEEQFYLVWPAVVWLVPRKWLAGLSVALAAAAVLLRAGLPWPGENIYRFTLSRLDGLAMGAFAAVAWREFREPVLRWVPRVLVAGAAIVLTIVAMSAGPTWDGPIRTWGESIFVLLAAALVLLARSGKGAAGASIERFCSTRLLRQCGKYSYAMYVLHVVPQWFFEHALVRMTGPFALVLALKYLSIPALAAAAYGLARISWRFLESPFLRLKDAPLASRARRTVVAEGVTAP